MACYSLPYIPLSLLFVFLPFFAVAQNTGRVAVGNSIIANDTATPWLSSPSGDFAFGLKQLQDKNLFLLSIWYNKIPDQTIVWYANLGQPVARGSKVELTSDRGLVLSDPQGKQLWISEPLSDVVDYGFMNDTGNFVLARRGSSSVWESFKNPTDTMLPTQIMEFGGVLYSRRTETNFSRGRFHFRLLPDGNVVLNTRDVDTDFTYDAYYLSNTYDGINSTNSGFRVIFNETGYMYVLLRNKQRKDLTPQIPFPTSEYYHRATLNFDGVFSQYYHPRKFSGTQNWTTLWSEPENICVNITGGQGSGACGYNSVCRLGDNKRPVCECPPGFSLLDPNDSYGSCKPRFTQSCDEVVQSSAVDLYDLLELIDTDWPTSDYAQLRPSNESMCRNSCLNDCFCAVAILRGESCWKKKLPLSNGRNDTVVNGKAFLKFRKGDPPPPPTPSGGRPPVNPNNNKTLILIGSVLLGGSLFINVVSIGALCIGFYVIHHKKIVKLQNVTPNTAAETNLHCFTYKELVEATDGFKEELGKGAFGIVYKGEIQMGSSINIVAVKKLDRVIEDKEREFKTEVNVIGKTHHKNLVRLYGFCDEGEHRMLVYEYLSNGTLASFLFGGTKPSWNQRSQIALGIARGLLYLHEECNTQIIHCDIKPQNILLDDYNNARIADFGLAKLLMMNQSQTNTGIRGTRGYVAPEWFRSRPITAKVDVYSFGVLLLEIISCRRSVGELEINGGELKTILTEWACDCFWEKKLDAFVENDMEALNDGKQLERFIKVAIWCIHDDPSLRPVMRKVTQMLEGVVEVAVPPCPSEFSFA